jgi:hypothetical protein
MQWKSIDAPRTLPKRFRWIGWLVVLAVVGGLVFFAISEGDKVVRGIASDVVRTGVTNALELPEGTDVDVDLGGGVLIFQAVTGSIDEVVVRVPNVALAEAAGTLVLTLNGVALDPSKPVDTLTADIEIDAANMGLLGARLSQAPLNSLVIGDKLVTIGADLAGNAVTASLTPAVAAGVVSFAPTAATIGGAPTSVEEVLAGPLAGAAGPMLTSQPFCVADYLPESLEVTAARVVGDKFVVTASGTGVRLSSLASNGVCGA